MRRTVFFLLVIGSSRLFAQADTGKSTVHAFQADAFIDTYYAWNFNRPHSKNIPLAYNHNRHNEFNVNLAFLRGRYTSEKVRGNLALQAGTYVEANYASETSVMKHILEANAGFRLSKTLWLDAGILPSHIGLETAVSKENWTLTRSLAAENTPYYETGVRATWSPDEKISVSGLVLNGWQNIHDRNDNKAIGSQFSFKPNDKLNLTISTFIGEARNLPDTMKRIRYFYDFYTTWQLNDRVSAAFLLDIGFEETSEHSKELQSYWSPVIIIKLKLNDEFACAARAEYFHDPEGIIIQTSAIQKFLGQGYSINLDYAPMKNLVWRIEARSILNDDKTFVKEGTNTNSSTTFTTSLAISF